MAEMGCGYGTPRRAYIFYKMYNGLMQIELTTELRALDI